MLSSIGSVPTEKQPRGFNIDASAATCWRSSALPPPLSSYRIDPESGKLIKLKNTHGKNRELGRDRRPSLTRSVS